MNNQHHISAAGNVEIPAYLALKEKGYKINLERKESEEFWYAVKGALKLTAHSPLELLGLASLFETKGENWKASDSQIESFIEKYEKQI